MYHLSSLAKRLAIIGLLLGILIAVPVACAGPTGPIGPAGPEGPAAPAGGIPVVVASPASVTIGADGMANLSTVGYAGAGWGTEKVVYLEMLMPDGTAQMLGAGICTKGAFAKAAAMPGGPPGGVIIKIDAGTYTVRATGKNTGMIAYAPVTISGGAMGVPPGAPPSGAPPSGPPPG